MNTVMLQGRGTVAYRSTGEGSETVVLVNGSVFNLRQWEGQPLPILQQGLKGRCRFLQYDYVGFGGSSAKTNPFSMQDLADELRDLLNALAIDEVHLMGISKGSLVGQTFLFRHPDQAKSFCGLGNPSLVNVEQIAATSNFQERVEALEELKDLWPQRINRQNYARLFNQVYVPAFFQKKYAELSLSEKLRVVLLRRMVYPALEGTFIQTIVDLFGYYSDLEDGLAKESAAYVEGLSEVADVPILLLNGTDDDITPIQLSRDLAERLPNSELVEFEGCTHIGPMMIKKQAEPIFGRYVNFLETVLDE